MINGKDLVRLGFAPSKYFKSALKFINLNVLSDEEIVRYMNSILPAPIEEIKQHSEPVHFFENIRAENEKEEANVNSVVSVMKKIMVTPTIVNGCVMPDACSTGEMSIPVGGVVVAKNAIPWLALS